MRGNIDYCNECHQLSSHFISLFCNEIHRFHISGLRTYLSELLQKELFDFEAKWERKVYSHEAHRKGRRRELKCNRHHGKSTFSRILAKLSCCWWKFCYRKFRHVRMHLKSSQAFHQIAFCSWNRRFCVCARFLRGDAIENEHTALRAVLDSTVIASRPIG